MSETVLITGISGFAGSFLAKHLASLNSHTIHGTYLSENGLQNISDIENLLTLHKVDLSQKEDVYRLIQEIKPQKIFHLAALTSPANSFSDPLTTITNNVAAQIHILDALVQYKKACRVLITSSAEVYGIVDQKDLPIDEETPLHPASPYAVSKIAQDFLAYQYFISYKISIIRVRPFNHIGPFQSPTFVASAFAKQIAEIEKGKKKPVITVGNLESKRDFTDVRDMVIAYDQILQKGIPGEVYNIGSGKSLMISELLKKLISLSHEEIKIEQDQKLFRPSDTPELVCDYSKLKSVTGWNPTIPLDKTLEEILNYWRNIV